MDDLVPWFRSSLHSTERLRVSTLNGLAARSAPGKCNGLQIQDTSVRLPYFGCGRRALEANKSEIDAVVGSGHMLGALDFMPAAAVDGGKRRIAVAASVHQRDQQPVGERQRLRIDVAAPGHHDGVSAAAQRIAARGGKRGVEPAGDDRTRRREAAVATDHDGGGALAALEQG